MAGIQLAPPPNPYSDQLAQALMQQGQMDQPIVTPMQGIGKLAQAIAGAYLHKKYGDKVTAYQQQHSQAINDALTKALSTNPSIFGSEDPSQIPMPSMDKSNPLVAAFSALSSDPTTLDQANQFGVQALMSQQKQDQKDNVTWQDLSQAEKTKRGYNPYQAIREKYVNGKPTGETEAVGSAQFDPSQVFKTQTTTTRDEQGSLIKRVVGTNKQGDVVSTQDLPAVEKALPVAEQNKVDAVIKAAGISQLFRDIVTQGQAQNWTGPISGPLAMKAQSLGFNDVGGDYAQAFAAAKEHYIAALNGLIPQRGKYILETLNKMGPSAAYSPERNLLQLSMTEGLLRGVAANTVKGYTNTEYHIDPDLFTLAKQGGYDPADPKSAMKDYLPSFVDKSNTGPQVAPPNSEIRQAKDGKLYYFDKNTKKNLGEVGG